MSQQLPSKEVTILFYTKVNIDEGQSSVINRKDFANGVKALLLLTNDPKIIAGIKATARLVGVEVEQC